MRRLMQVALVSMLVLGVALISSGMFPAQAQSEDPFGQDQINKLSARVDLLETQNENLQITYAALQEIQIATITMLLTNYAGDCLIESVIRVHLELESPNQGECMSFRMEYFDALPIEQRPGYELIEPAMEPLDLSDPDLFPPGV